MAVTSQSFRYASDDAFHGTIWFVLQTRVGSDNDLDYSYPGVPLRSRD